MGHSAPMPLTLETFSAIIRSLAHTSLAVAVALRTRMQTKILKARLIVSPSNKTKLKKAAHWLRNTNPRPDPRCLRHFSEKWISACSAAGILCFPLFKPHGSTGSLSEYFLGNAPSSESLLGPGSGSFNTLWLSIELKAYLEFRRGVVVMFRLVRE
jgi:hypothetical protein